MAIEHRVMLTLKPGVDGERIKGLLAALQHKVTVTVDGQLQPLIHSFQWVRNVSVEAVSGPKEGFVMILVDPTPNNALGESLIDAYLDHPEHIRVRDEMLPHLAEVIVCDYLVATPPSC